MIILFPNFRFDLYLLFWHFFNFFHIWSLGTLGVSLNFTTTFIMLGTVLHRWTQRQTMGVGWSLSGRGVAILKKIHNKIFTIFWHFWWFCTKNCSYLVHISKKCLKFSKFMHFMKIFPHFYLPNCEFSALGGGGGVNFSGFWQKRKSLEFSKSKTSGQNKNIKIQVVALLL